MCEPYTVYNRFEHMHAHTYRNTKDTLDNNNKSYILQFQMCTITILYDRKKGLSGMVMS